MTEKKPELPFGWIVKQSKSHPDRIYYFNVNTGASTWEFPDLLQHYVNRKGNTVEAPVLSATLLKSGNTDAVSGSLSKSSDSATHVPQKRNVPQALAGSDTHTTAGANRKRTSTCTLQESNCPPKRDLICETNNRNMSPQQRFVSRHRKKLQENLCKSEDKSFHDTKRNVDQSDVKEDQILKRTKESSKYVHSAQLPLSGAKPTHNQKQSDESRAGIQGHTKTERKTDFSGDSKNEKSQVSLKTMKQKEQTELTDKLLSLIQKKLPEHGGKRKATDSSKVVGGADVYKSLNAISKCVKSLGSCLNERKKSAENSSIEVTPCQAKRQKLKTQEHKNYLDKAEKLKTAITSTSSSEKTKNVPLSSYKGGKRKKLHKDMQGTADTRKVVRSSQLLSTDNRNVSLKDKKINNLQMNEKLTPTLDLTVSTSAAQVSNCSIPVEDGVNLISDYNYDTSTEFKVFIGDKEKLMSIQSWINNLQENTGSASPSVDTQAVLGLVNDSVDSGYVSPGNTAATPLKRGWPGAVKKPDNTTRDVVVMEVDECLLPQLSPAEYDEEECMDIDEVLVEVRQQVCSSNIKRTGSFITSLSETDQTQLSGTDQSQQAITNDHTITVVVDTNVLINDLKLLERLKGYPLPGCNMKPCLFIPWIVLRELDALKETVKADRPNMSLATQKKARRGIAFLKELFSCKHPRVKGQTPKQADEAAINFKSECNDDVILQACLQCQKSAQHVVLLTNDNNLINKALVSGVPAFGAKDIISGLQKASDGMVARPECLTPSNIQCTKQENVQCQTPISAQRLTPACVQGLTPRVQGLTPVIVPDIEPEGFQCQTVSNFEMKENNSVTQKGESSHLLQRDGTIEDIYSQNLVRCDKQTVLPSSCKLQQTCLVDKILKSENNYSVDALVDDIYMRMLALLKEALGEILEVEMKKAYDDIWTDIVYIKPPWSLKDILLCWKKHWMAVFGLVFSRHLSKNVHMLLDYTSISNRITIDVVCDICVESSEILEEAKNRNLYGPRIPEITQTVIILRDLCYDIKLVSVSAESIPSLEHYILSKVDRQSSGSVQQPCVKVAPENCQTAQHISTAVINTVLSTSESQARCGEMLLPDCVQTLPTPAPQTGPQLSDNSGLQPAAPQQSSGDEQGSSVQLMTHAGNQIEQAESIAGERFSQIWKFIYKYCNEFYTTLSGTTAVDTTRMEPILKELVSTSLDLRKYYSGLLELPVDVLKNHEKEFTALSNMCNTFFSKFEIQEARPLVTPIHLLILYSKPEYRETLRQFLGQLDEMLHVMYQCLNKLCPDD